MSDTDPQLNEPVIGFFQKVNSAAIHRVLERAQENARNVSVQNARNIRASCERGVLTKTLDTAMDAYRRSRQNQPSIRQTAPDTGGRPFHFGYSTVTKGSRAAKGTPKDPSNKSCGSNTSTTVNGKPSNAKSTTAGTRRNRQPTANTQEAAHQIYTERDSVVDRNARSIDDDRDLTGPSTGISPDRPEPERLAGAGQEQQVKNQGLVQTAHHDFDHDESERTPGHSRATDKRRKADLTPDLGEDVLSTQPSLSKDATPAQTQAYIENPDKLHGTKASFGTIGDTLAERMEFWDLVHEHESSAGGRTQARIVLELPHEATTEQRHMIVRTFTDDFRRKGIPFWASIHTPTKDNDIRNFHAHVVLTERPMRRMVHPTTGKVAWDFTINIPRVKKNRNKVDSYPYRQNRDPEMRRRDYLEVSRARFSEVVNSVMSASSIKVRYDPRSYVDMGLDVTAVRNVSRILADKLGKQSFVVMDAEWTRRAIDAEIQAAALHRDETFRKLLAANIDLKRAAQSARATLSRTDNAKLPEYMRVSPLSVGAHGTSGIILDKLLRMRQNHEARRFTDESMTKALEHIIAATKPASGKTAKRAHDPSTAPDPEALLEIYQAALEELAARQRAATSRARRHQAEQEATGREWQGQPPGRTALPVIGYSRPGPAATAAAVAAMGNDDDIISGRSAAAKQTVPAPINATKATKIAFGQRVFGTGLAMLRRIMDNADNDPAMIVTAMQQSIAEWAQAHQNFSARADALEKEAAEAFKTQDTVHRPGPPVAAPSAATPTQQTAPTAVAPVPAKTPEPTYTTPQQSNWAAPQPGRTSSPPAKSLPSPHSRLSENGVGLPPERGPDQPSSSPPSSSATPRIVSASPDPVQPRIVTLLPRDEPSRPPEPRIIHLPPREPAPPAMSPRLKDSVASREPVIVERLPLDPAPRVPPARSASAPNPAPRLGNTTTKTMSSAPETLTQPATAPVTPAIDQLRTPSTDAVPILPPNDPDPEPGKPDAKELARRRRKALLAARNKRGPGIG